MIVIYILAALFASLFLIAAIMPGKYSIQKTITINAPQQNVFGKVADFNNYRDWNPWQKMEPDAKSTISGTASTKGHRYEWDGKKIGAGSLTVNELKGTDAIHIDLEFLRPWKAKANDDWKFEKAGEGQTKVTWSNDGPLAYPMGRLMGPMISKNLNIQFEQGLKNLKEMCEK